MRTPQVSWWQLGFGAVGTGIIVMLDNEPADVTSSLSHWYELATNHVPQLPQLPHVLVAPAADTVAYVVAFGLLAVAALPTIPSFCGVEGLGLAPRGRESAQDTAPAPAPATTALPPHPSGRTNTTPDDPQAKHDLAEFAVEYILPACEAQRAVQNAIIHKLSNGAPVIEGCARVGAHIEGSAPGFEEEWKNLTTAVTSGKLTVSLERLIFLVGVLSVLYPNYCNRAEWFCHGTTFDFRTEPSWNVPYQQWW